MIIFQHGKILCNYFRTIPESRNCCNKLQIEKKNFFNMIKIPTAKIRNIF